VTDGHTHRETHTDTAWRHRSRLCISSRGKNNCARDCTIEANYWHTRSIARPFCDSRATCRQLQSTTLTNPTTWQLGFDSSCVVFVESLHYRSRPCLAHLASGVISSWDEVLSPAGSDYLPDRSISPISDDYRTSSRPRNDATPRHNRATVMCSVFIPPNDV